MSPTSYGARTRFLHTDKSGQVLTVHDAAFRRIEGWLSTLRRILSADMLRILGYRLIEVAEEIEPAPVGLRGPAYGWQRTDVMVRDLSEYRAARLVAELDDAGYVPRDIADELVRHHIPNKGGRLEWRLPPVRAILQRERGRRSLAAGIDAPGSPLVDGPTAGQPPELMPHMSAE